MISTSEAALILGCTESNLRYLAQGGWYGATKRAGERGWSFDRDAVVEAAAKKRATDPAPAARIDPALDAPGVSLGVDPLVHQLLVAENEALKQRVELAEKDREITDLRGQLAARDRDLVSAHERMATLQAQLGEERRRRRQYQAFVMADVERDLEPDASDFLDT